MKKYGKYLIIVLATLFVGLCVWKKDVEVKTLPKNDVIVAFGDSLVHGVGATEGNDFVSLVSKRIGIPIINEGKSGDTTAAALDRVEQILAYDPGVVIVLLGGNDYLRRMDRTTTFQNLRTIIRKFKENNTRVLLLGVRGGLLKDIFEADFRILAKEEGVPYVSNVLDGLLGNKKFMSDEVHPNDLGYKVIAERVTPVLQKMLK